MPIEGDCLAQVQRWAGILPLLRILALHYLNFPRNAPYLLGHIALFFPEWQGWGILGARVLAEMLALGSNTVFLFGSFLLLLLFKILFYFFLRRNFHIVAQVVSEFAGVLPPWYQGCRSHSIPQWSLGTTPLRSQGTLPFKLPLLVMPSHLRLFCHRCEPSVEDPALGGGRS